MTRIGEPWQRNRPKTASERKLIRERMARAALEIAAKSKAAARKKRKAKR